MKTSPRPELKEPVAAFAAKLAEGRGRIPLAEFAALFGADEDLLQRVATRGDIVFTDETFSNDGPQLVVPAGRVELEISDLLRGKWSAGDGSFTMSFPSTDFTVSACVKLAFVRKCFDLREIRATPTDLTLDFNDGLADRRYTF